MKKMGESGWTFRFEAPPAWRLMVETLNKESNMYTRFGTPKSFRSYTGTIPMDDKTVVMHDSRGFANTLREKIDMLRSSTDNYVYVAWPGKIETHIFRGTPGDVLGALIEKAYPVEGR